MAAKIALDAGHGLYTAGKRCMKALDANETREWVLNSRIADKLEKMLAGYDCAVMRVDDRTGRRDIPLAERVAAANSWGADIYVSIHHNAGVNGRAGGGIVVYYCSANSERNEQARDLYNALISATALRGNRSQGVINYPFYVIKNTFMPAFLIENGFMDSSTDVPIILSEEHADKTAQGLFNFLVKELRLAKYKAEEKPAAKPAESGSFKVKVTVDELNIRAGAGTKHAVVGVIKDKGVYTIVETKGSWGRLLSGAGWINTSSKYTKRV